MAIGRKRAYARPQGDFIELPNGLFRPADESYIRAGRRPPSQQEIHVAASIRVSVDKKLKRRTPDWIKAWAEHPDFRG